MFKFRISATSSRIPLALFVLEITVFFAAILATAYLDLFQEIVQVDLSVWLVRATVFSAAMIFSMLLFKLYQGRPNESIAMGVVRMGGSFALLVFAAGCAWLAPTLRIELPSLAMAIVLAFFFLGTVRPVFLDSVTERRGGRRADRREEGEGLAEGLTDEEFLKRLSENPPKTTTLTGQHRITRRGL